ncbi:MAG: glycosyltransferase family 4 protein [Bacteroidetes bacterium]|nr:glycosyltransferase family 4 protein [Bacteroidota bacterium]
MQQFSYKEISTAFSAKKFFKKRSFEILTASSRHIPMREILELYLYISGSRDFGWIDYNGNYIAAHSFFKNLKNLFEDLVLWYPAIKRIKQQLTNLENTVPVKKLPLLTDAKFLYLRTDHWFNLRSGGSVGHVSGVVNEMRANQWLSQIISTDTLFEVDCTSLFTKVSPDYSSYTSIPELATIIYNEQLIKFLSSTTIDSSVIYQRYSQFNYSGVWLKHHLKMPLVLEFNGSEVWAMKNWGSGKMIHSILLERIERLNLQHADLIVVVSENLKNDLVASGVEAAKILVTPNGVSLTKFNTQLKSAVVRERYQLQEKFIFGFIGTFGEWHGVVELAKAIVSLFTAHTELRDKIRFLLIGNGNLLPLVKKIIADATCTPYVTYTGAVPQNTSPEHLAACDVLVSPHIQNTDGTKFFGSPTKLFEYMALGKPIIASDLEQIGVILKHNYSALLVPPGDIEALANSFYEMYINFETYKQLGKNAYTTVAENYTWAHHVRKIAKACSVS